jgi:ribosomal protein S18 acetylase RimI-like enzyme
VPDSRISIRPYQERDRPAALALARRLTIGVAPWRAQAAVERAVAGWVSDSLDEATAAERAVLVAVDADEVVGLVTLGTRTHFTGEVDAYVGELIVAESRERRGIGARLVRAAESWAARRGFAHLTLETGAANAAARTFYSSLGFAEEDVRLTKSVDAAEYG